MNKINVNTGFRDIHPNAQIGEGAQIGSFVTIEEDVVIGKNAQIYPNAVIMNGTRIGDNCKIFPGAIIGAVPQDLKFQGEDSILKIGNNVTIREYCTINRGTKANYSTVIEDNCLIMAYVHVAHDCVIQENCVLANNVTLAGHIHVGARSVLGGLTAVHQFVRIGSYVMVGGGSLVRKDIPPFVKAAREPLAYSGVNAIGLKRRGFSPDQINQIQDIYRLLYVKGLNTSQAIEQIKEDIPSSPEKDRVLHFITNANRGIIKGYRHLNGNRC